MPSGLNWRFSAEVEYVAFDSDASRLRLANPVRKQIDEHRLSQLSADDCFKCGMASRVALKVPFRLTLTTFSHSFGGSCSTGPGPESQHC